MKKVVLLFIVTLLLSIIAFGQNTYVPDDNFEQALIDLGYDSGTLDNYVLTANIDNLTLLNISNKNISDLTGIEDFIALGELNCNNNLLTTLDVSQSPYLTTLKCLNNSIINLDISLNTAVSQLNCKDNNLETLNVKNGNNVNFTNFNATGNPNLTCIQVNDATYSTTNWTNIDPQSSFSNNCYYLNTYTYIPDNNFELNLVVLGYDSGPLDDYVLTTNINTVTSLDMYNENISDLTGIEDFIALEVLKLGANSLISLDISNNTALTELYVNSNDLTSLNVSNNTALTILKCHYNNLTSLDVSNNTALTELIVRANDLTNLDVSNNTALTELSCGGNALTNLDVSNNTALFVLRCDNNDLTSIDVTNNTALTTLTCYSNQITSLDISNNTVLIELDINNNDLTSLNAQNGNNTNVTIFDTTGNSNLTCIQVDDATYSTTNWTDISFQTSFSNNCYYPFTYTYVPDDNFEQALIDLGYDTDGLNDYVLNSNINSITSLDISNKNIIDLTGIEGFLALTSLNVSQNALTYLNLSLNRVLINLNCNNNNLESLNIQNGNNTAINNFFANSNPNLSCIQVEDAAYSTSNWTNIDVQTSFNEDCHYLETYIPDSNFELFLETHNRYFPASTVTLGSSISIGNGIIDGYVTTEVINNITSLYMYNENISDLTGIEGFISLTSLNSGGNQLTTIDVSQNTLLTELSLNNNQLTTIDVSQNTLLTELSLSYNQLTTINTLQNTTLLELDIGANNLTSLDVSQNNQLTYLSCYNNQLTNLNISQNNQLTYLSCGTNQLTNLDISQNTLLETLNCVKNNLDNIDISNNTSLLSLNLENNNLTSIDVSNNTALTSLRLSFENKITHLDVSNNTALITLTCSSNNLTYLDISNNTALTTLSCNVNNLTYLNAKNGNDTNFIIFDTLFNPQLQCIEVDDAVYSTTSWINIDSQTSFSENCHYPDLYTYIPDDNFEQVLIDLGYDTDGLNDYVLNSNINTITSLDINNKNISDITGIENFTALITLTCADNTIINLDVSQNTFLTQLNCKNNALEFLNFQNGNNTNVTIFDATGNPNLTCIQVDDVVYSGSNWLNRDFQSNFSQNCHYLETYIPDDNFEQALIDSGYDSGPLDDYVLTTNINTLVSLGVSNKNIYDLTGIEDFTGLEYLGCIGNNLTYLDVSSNTALTVLECSYNNLTSLDVSNNTALFVLDCRYNDLNNLDVKNGNNENFTRFEATFNPNLTCIEVSSYPWAVDNWSSDIDLQASFSPLCVGWDILISPKIFLQGAYINPTSWQGSLMRDNLRTSGLIPTTSPYADALTCDASVFTPTGANAIVDWVWIEIRDRFDNTNIIEGRSGLLQRDGDIVDTNGNSPISFNVQGSSYYVSVSHRNHLGIISSNTVEVSSSTTTLNLSNNSALINGGTNAVIDLGNGIFGLYSGDYDGNGQVQNTDLTSITPLLGQPSTYDNADLDMNTQVQNTDINNLLNPNKGRGQQFAKQQDLKLYAKRKKQ